MSLTLQKGQRVVVSSTGVIGTVTAIPDTDSYTLYTGTESLTQEANQALYPNYLSALTYILEAQVTFENPNTATRQDVQALLKALSPATYLLGPTLAIDSISPPTSTNGARSLTTQTLFAVVQLAAGNTPAVCQLMAAGTNVRHLVAKDASGNPLAYLTSSLEGPVLIATVDTPANKTLSLSQQTAMTLALPTSTSQDLYYRVMAALLVEQDYTTAAGPKVTASFPGWSNGVAVTVSTTTTMPVPSTNVAPVVQRSLMVQGIVKVPKVAKGGASTQSLPISIVSTLADGTSRLIGAKVNNNIVTYALGTA